MSTMNIFTWPTTIHLNMTANGLRSPPVHRALYMAGLRSRSWVSVYGEGMAFMDIFHTSIP
jgi:hypothetical protein